METTERLGLSLPSYEDGADVAVLNENFKKLDAEDGAILDNTRKIKNSAGGVAIGDNASASGGFAGGTSARATQGGAAGYSASAGDGAAVGIDAHSESGAALGETANAKDGGAVGKGAKTSDGFAGGKDAVCQSGISSGSAIDAVQLGTGTNTNEKTLQVYGNQLLDADGNIPKERMSQNVLTKDNAASYTPTGSYHPATKKYVDDAVGKVEVSADRMTGVLPVTKGGTGVSSLTGTDYGTSRVRGIALQAAIPSSIPNGCLVGVYV